MPRGTRFLLRQRSFPFAPVRPCTSARVLDPRRTRSVSGTPATGCAPATPRAVATRCPLTIFVPTPATCGRGLVTLIDAVTETPPVDAVSVPLAVRVDAVKTVDAPTADERRPSALEESDQSGEAATALPNASEPDAVNVCDAPARIDAVAGATARCARGPATTVSGWATPPAVIVGVPASESV